MHVYKSRKAREILMMVRTLQRILIQQLVIIWTLKVTNKVRTQQTMQPRLERKALMVLKEIQKWNLMPKMIDFCTLKVINLPHKHVLKTKLKMITRLTIVDLQSIRKLGRPTILVTTAMTTITSPCAMRIKWQDSNATTTTSPQPKRGQLVKTKKATSAEFSVDSYVKLKMQAHCCSYQSTPTCSDEASQPISYYWMVLLLCWWQGHCVTIISWHKSHRSALDERSNVTNDEWWCGDVSRKISCEHYSGHSRRIRSCTINDE